MTQEITNTVQRFFAAVDGRDWGTARALMTDPFHLDYASFGGGPAADLDPGQVLEGWKGLLPGFDATQHHLGPLAIEVDGDTARVAATVIATHFIAGAEGGETWTVHGHYRLALRREEGWKLTDNVFLFDFVTGNGGLPSIAQTRVTERGAA